MITSICYNFLSFLEFQSCNLFFIDEWQQVLTEEENSNDDFGDYVQNPVPGRRRRRRRRRWRIRIRGRKIWGYYRKCCDWKICSPKYCIG